MFEIGIFTCREFLLGGMTEEITVEVDPSELSDEVVKGLVEDGFLMRRWPRSTGIMFGLRKLIRVRRVRRGSVSYMKEKFRNGKELASWLRWLFSDYKTVLVDIESVERTDNDRVKLQIRHGRIGRKTVTLYPDSTKMANILEWKGVDNPLELEGSRIPILRDSFDDLYNYILIPHNVSASGRLRFLLYNGVEEIREKTKVSRIYEDPEGFVMGSVILTVLAWIVFVIPASVASNSGMEWLAGLFMIPLVLSLAGIGLLVSYGLFRAFLSVLSGLFDSEYIEVRCR